MDYQAMYKCCMCGETFPMLAEMNQENATDLANILTGRKVDETLEQMAFASMLKKKVHNCKDGSIGIAYLQGFKAINARVC